jgi:hypothetical protein
LVGTPVGQAFAGQTVTINGLNAYNSYTSVRFFSSGNPALLRKPT